MAIIKNNITDISFGKEMLTTSVMHLLSSFIQKLVFLFTVHEMLRCFDRLITEEL